MKGKFFDFIKPAIDLVDNGSFFKRPFSWLYLVFAVLNLLMPLFILYQAIQFKAFSGGFKFVASFVLMWIFVAAASWVGFQIWWNRKDKVLESSSDSDEFVSTPVFTHFIQSFGEWLGSFIAIAGFGVALVSTIFGTGGIPGLDMLGGGFINIILAPLQGFLIIIVFRFIAEQARALVQIANNTKK
jgi:hypothetical protein